MDFQIQKISAKPQKISLRSFSKINFALWIKEKRPDGYHEIETIFYENKDLYDEIEVDFTEGIKLDISVLFSDQNLDKRILLQNNLAYKAASAFLNKIGVVGSCQIKIKKQIPMEAGLGGGSSNAAFVLKALNEIFDYPLHQSELLNIAARIGSDVSFFIIGETCLGNGRGEILKKLENNLSLEIKIVKPQNISVSTKWAYELIDGREFIPSHSDEIKSLINAMKKGDYNLFCKNLFNDFENIIFSNFPDLIKLRNNLLKEGFSAVGLCGSGSALYAIKPKTN
jgi:4-diphosphocytidyl-2-C-methyl-D-erythritol kinase